MRESRLLPILILFAALALACGNAQPAAQGGGGGGGTVCTACHGGQGPAAFTSGTDPNLAAAPPAPPPNKPQAVIGAHQAHVNPNPAASPPPLSFPRSCDECHHPVPTDSAHSAGGAAFPTVSFNGIALGPSVTTDGANLSSTPPVWNGVDSGTAITTPTCSAVYCHGSFRWFGDGASGADVKGNAFAPDWTMGSSQAACGTCHDLPPQGHIQNAFIGTSPSPMVCNGCHPGTVDASGNIIVDAQTGASKHINGEIDEGAHTDPNWYVATDPNGGDHGFQAVQAANGLQYCEQCHTGFTSPLFPANDPGTSCNDCHGNLLTGAATSNWQQNCVFCHGDKTQILTWAAPATTTIGPLWAAVAPPVGPLAETGTTTTAVGAHQQHVGALNVLSNPFACTECHTSTLPTDVTHVNGQPVPVELTGLTATSGTVQGTWNLSPPTCSATYCHGNFYGGNGASPTWTVVNGTSAQCTSCHGATLTGGGPSAAPNDGAHAFHVILVGAACSVCHPTGYSNSQSTPTTGTVVVPLHVNGVVDMNPAAGYSCGVVGCQPRGTTFGTCTNSCHSTPSPTWP